MIFMILFWYEKSYDRWPHFGARQLAVRPLIWWLCATDYQSQLSACTTSLQRCSHVTPTINTVQYI